MRKKFVSVLATMLVGAMAFTGCGSSQPAKQASSDESAAEATGEDVAAAEETSAEGEKIARMVPGTEPGSLHPALAQGTNESVILDHIFEGLMKRNEKSEIVPGMAESYEMSEDGLTYTFKIRQDAKWSNGDPVTAKDFEVAWKYALNPESGSQYAYQLYYLEGGQEYNEGKGSEDAVGVKAIDDQTLEVKLKAPTAFFLELCAFYTYYPVDSAVQEAKGADWAKDAESFVCNGPFVLSQWDHDSEIDVKKNDNYYNKDAIKLDGIEFKLTDDNNTMWQMYQNHEIDIDYDLPTDVIGQLKAENNPELTIGPELANYFYRFNTTEKPFNNVKVRKALTMAIDRQLIIDEVAQGGQTPAYALVPNDVNDDKGDFRANGGDFIKEDVEEAKKLLEEGLSEEGMTPADFKFTILYNTSEGHKRIAEAIQQMWRENLGVDVSLENVEFQVKVDREHALDFQVSRAGWIGDYIDPNTFLDMFTSWSTQNDTGWTSADFDKLIKDAGAELDPAKRMDDLHQAEKIFMDDMPIMPIYYYTRPYTTQPYLTGVIKAPNRDVSLVYADLTNDYFELAQ